LLADLATIARNVVQFANADEITLVTGGQKSNSAPWTFWT